MRRTLTPPICGTSLGGLTNVPTDCPASGSGPVCTKVETVPVGSNCFNIYCGNPHPGGGAITKDPVGQYCLNIVKCDDSTGYCLKIDQSNVGVTFIDKYQILAQTTPIDTSNGHGQWPKYDSLPVSIGLSTLYLNSSPCSSTGDIFVAIHQDNGADTCWAGNEDLPDNNWALQMHFKFSCQETCTTFCCCPEHTTPSGPFNCFEETGWAKGNSCFLDNACKNGNGQGGQWGWFIGPTSGTITAEIYGGAAGCNTGVGTNPASVKITSSGSDNGKPCYDFEITDHTGFGVGNWQAWVGCVAPYSSTVSGGLADKCSTPGAFTGKAGCNDSKKRVCSKTACANSNLYFMVHAETYKISDTDCPGKRYTTCDAA